MKIKISKKNKQLAAIYLAVLIILYVVIYIVPKVTHVFETTQVLETGTLVLSCEGTGYIVKDETVNIAVATGDMAQSEIEGTVVKKGTKIVSIKESDSEEGIHGKYKPYLERLKDYDGLKKGTKAPISGVCSYCIDGYENYFTIDNLEKLKKEKVESLQFENIDLNRGSAVEGEPVFKISRDDNWYVVCWLKKDEASEFDEGMDVSLEFPDGSVPAYIKSISRQKDFYKIDFYVNSYYENFASVRSADITIVKSNNTGLIVDNVCIIKKDGIQGVYVIDKNGDYRFKEIKVKASDGKQSVLYDSTFTNDKYELVETVNVYDEVLRHPEKALEAEKEKSKEGN